MVTECERSRTLQDLALQNEINDPSNEEASNLRLFQNQKVEADSEISVNYFFIQLIICSFLLWVLLFVGQSHYRISTFSTIEAFLTKEITYEPIQIVKHEFEQAITQILL